MKTIRGKITSAVIMSVSVSLFIMGAISAYLNLRSTNSTLELTMNEMAIVAGNRIHHELNEYLNVAYETGGLSRLSNSDLSVEEKKNIIDQKVKSHNFERGNILDKNGKSIFDGKDYSEREYFKEALNGNGYVSEPIYSKLTGEKCVIVSAPLWKNGETGTVVEGVVYYVPKTTFLNDIVSSINVGKTGLSLLQFTQK